MNNETLSTILTRRSVKKYKSDPISKEILDQIIEAGLRAPSSLNRQSPIIIAVTSKTERDRLAKWNADIMGTDSDPFYGAPVVLVVLADKNNLNHVYDGSLVMENLMLAAHSFGLGSCWIHRAKEMFNRPEGKEWLKHQGIAGDYEGIGNCIIGVSDTNPDAHPIRPGRVFYV